MGKAMPVLHRCNDVEVIELNDQHGCNRPGMSGAGTSNRPYVGKARVGHRLAPRVAGRLI